MKKSALIITIIALWTALTGIHWWMRNRGCPVSTPLPVLLDILAPSAFFLAGRLVPGSRQNFAQLAILSPSFLAPLSLLYPWAAVPGNLPGIGVVGFTFFLHWLTKYPNFGPVNLEVLLGILCVFSAALVPVLFAFSVVGGAGRKTQIVLTIIYLVVFIPLFLRLDLWMWILGIAGVSSGSLSLIFGPLIRLLVIFSMLISLKRPVIITEEKDCS